MSKLPWSERVTSFQVNPESATLQDIVRMAEELVEANQMLDWLEIMAEQPGGLLLHNGMERGRLGLGLLGRPFRKAVKQAMQ